MYAIMGITGQVGSALAEALLSKGKQVRAIARDAGKASATWKNRASEIVVADFNDAEVLTSAFKNVEGVFIMLPPSFTPEPGFPEARAIVAAIRKALIAAKVHKFVALSSIGAQRDSGLGIVTSLHILEEELRTLNIPGAFLRAGWFMENSRWDVQVARDQGKLVSYLHPLDKPFPFVATNDVGRIGADILLQTWTGNRFIEVAGPRYYSPNELAKAFSQALNRSVEAVALPHDTWADSFVAQGTPANKTELRIQMLDGFNSGWMDFGVEGTEHVKGTVSLEEVVKSLVETSK